MANSCVNRLAVSGAAGKVAGFYESFLLANPWIEVSTVEYGLYADAGVHSAFVEFESPAKRSLAALELSSLSNPSLVITLAYVELDYGNAEARVLKGGSLLGEYVMDRCELEELAGEDFREQPVLDCLLAMVTAYEFDALQAAPPSP